MPIDLRSDTVTQPTDAMRQAMARAEVGDDVFGEDPTVRALEDEMARITGKQAGLFVSSGTMGNQLAIALQTRHGDDVIVGEGAHPVHYETGAAAALSGVQFSVAGRGGFYDPEDLTAALYAREDWAPRSALAMLENTHNRAGGRVWPEPLARAVAERARTSGLRVHLDGARLWNASVVCGLAISELCAPFDTASLCFSKGLGAPVGSALVGRQDLIAEARRTRKRWGGGMRQSGILAAAALHALAHHRERLADDHANARVFATRLLAGARSARIDLASVETNIVNVDLDRPAAEVALRCRERGLLINATGPARLRAVTHLGVERADAEAAADVLVQVLNQVGALRNG